ncbi:MAG: hypothetical protein IT383_03205 [Deltaproteobacteria bacterium]|nr:hypothetical protein [Deltaproteobacteria bacterium]
MLWPIVYCVVATVVGLTFASAVEGSYLALDDGPLVKDNPAIASGLTWESFQWAWSGVRAANWHPLTYLSWQLDVELFGTEARGHLLVSVLLHALNSALLCWLLVRFVGLRFGAIAGALWFGIHPLRVESVAWVVERKDTLSGLFVLAALALYLWHRERPSTVRAGGVVLALVAALLSKQSAVVVPAFFVCLDFWPLGRLRLPRTPTPPAPDVAGLWRRILEKAPYLLVCALGALPTLLAPTGGQLSSLERIPLDYRLANMVVTIPAYLLNALWPSGLHVLVVAPLDGFSGAAVLVALAVVVAVTVLVVAARVVAPHWLLAWVWLLAGLVPVSGLFWIGNQSMADRFSYLPMLGIAFALAKQLDLCFARAKTLTSTAASVVAVALMLVTVRQIGYWRDDETLLRRSLDANPANWAAVRVLVDLAMDRQQPRLAIQVIEEMPPGSRDADLSWLYGEALLRVGRAPDAVEVYLEALSYNPRTPSLHTGLAAALAATGDLEHAQSEALVAIDLDPVSSRAAVVQLAGALRAVGAPERAALLLVRASAGAGAAIRAEIDALLCSLASELRARSAVLPDDVARALATCP